MLRRSRWLVRINFFRQVLLASSDDGIIVDKFSIVPKTSWPWKLTVPLQSVQGIWVNSKFLGGLFPCVSSHFSASSSERSLMIYADLRALSSAISLEWSFESEYNPVLVRPEPIVSVQWRPSMENEHMVEEVMVGGEPIRLRFENVPIERIELDESNPRIRYRLKLEQDGKGLEQVILSVPEVKKLRKDIETNKGLRERVILQENGARFKTIEGNCRLVCLQSLHLKDKNNPAWKTVPARVLPKDVDPKQIAILLADFHVAGKITWQAHEKAGQVYLMANDLHMGQDEIATYLRTSKTTVSRLLQAYELMRDHFLRIDNEKYAKQGERKWSFFEEFFKQKDLREELKKNPAFGDDFCGWVGEGRLPEGADVRLLPTLLANPAARNKFLSSPAPSALSDAMKVLEQSDPEQGSEFFKLLAKFREACTNAAQVKEILRIRADKVAREKVVKTYEALVDFMRLADIEPPSISSPGDK